MRKLVILIFLLASRVGFAQVIIAAAAKELTDTSASMKIFKNPDGSYRFTYQNILSQKTDLSTVVFKNRGEANLFVIDIRKAFELREGSVSKVNYGSSQITLMPASNGSVFMRLETKGKNVSAFEINKLTFRQINIFR